MNSVLKPKHMWDRILFVLAMLLLMLTIVDMFTIWNLSFHSDSASANMLAREQIRTGDLFPGTWNYATGLIIFSFNNLIIPLSLFTQNQIILRAAAVTVFLIVFVLVFHYFSRKILNSNFHLISLIVIFSGTSAMVIDVGFAQAGYLNALIEYLGLPILFVLSITEEWEIKNIRCFIGLLVCLVYLSLHGPLNFAYCLFPFLGGIALLFLFQYKESPWNIVHQKLVKIAKVIIPMISAAAIGMVGYRELCRRVNFQFGVNITYPDNANMVNRFTQCILSAIGYRTGVSLFSLHGLTNVLVVFGFIVIVVCCTQLFRKYDEQPFAIKLLMNVSLIACAIILYFDVTTYFITEGMDRYFFRPLMLMIFLASYYIYTYIFSQGVLAKVAVIVLLAAFSLPNMLASIPQVIHYPQARAAQLGLVNFLEDNDLKHGYATFWNAGNNMVLSDFEVEIGGVYLTDPIIPQLWLSSITTYDSDAYSGDSFLLLTESENAGYSDSNGLQRLGEPKEILTFENYTIYVYPYNIAENGYAGRYQNAEFIENMWVSDEAMIDVNGTIHLTAGQVIYGPYIALGAGQYQIDLNFSEFNNDVVLSLTSDVGANILLNEVLKENAQAVTFEL